jgi:hypothetical protein
MHGRGRSPDVEDEAQEEEVEPEAEMDPNEFFEIVGSAPARNTSRCTEQTRYLVRFREVEECNRPDQLLERVLDAIYSQLLEGRPTPKLIGLSLQPPDFQAPYNIPLRGLEQNSSAVIAAAIQDLALRYPTLDPFSGTCEIKVSIVWPLSATAAASSGPSAVGPSGACSTLPPEEDGGETPAVASHQQLAPKRCQSLWAVSNPQDRWCLPRAVYMGCVFHRLLPVPAEVLEQSGSNTRIAAAPHVPKKFLQQQQQLHTPHVVQMMTEAGIPEDLEFYGLPEARLLQTWLTQQFGLDSVRLIILGYEQQYRVVFRGVDHPTRINLCIYLQQKHYSFVGRPEQLFNVCI